jgi:hypothetical protein
MDMRRVVPSRRKVRGITIEDDPAAHEHESLDETLDGAELMRDEQDRHDELAVEPGEQSGKRLLRVDINACSRFVEDEQIGLSRKRLRDEGALLLPARQACDDGVRVRGEADPGDRCVDHRPVGGAKRPDNATPRDAAGGGDLPHSGRSVDRQLRPLGKVRHAGATPGAVSRLSVETDAADGGPLEAERKTQ